MQTIRKLEKNDKEAIDRLFQADNTVLLWNFDHFLNHTDHYAKILEINGRVIGFGALVRRISPRYGYVGKLDDVFIHPDFQGGGLGKCLINEMIGLGKSLCLNRIYLTSNPKRKAARHIYVSLGFEEYETGNFFKKL